MLKSTGSALFLRRCPPASPIAHCVFFGSGEQIYAHASVFLRLYGSIERCAFVVRSKNERAVGLVRRLEAEHPTIVLHLWPSDGADMSSSTELSDLLSTAQVIVAATSSQKALFPTSSVRPGTRVILIGSYKPHMREVEDSLLRRGSRVVVDSKKACLQEAGELISAGMTEEDLEELGSIREDGKAVRSGEDVVLFKSVSFSSISSRCKLISRSDWEYRTWRSPSWCWTRRSIWVSELK
jgi:ornithine cyclodeaminase